MIATGRRNEVHDAPVLLLLRMGEEWVGLGREGAAERNRTAKEKQSKVQKINPRSEPGGAKKKKNHDQTCQKSLPKVTKITPKRVSGGPGRQGSGQEWPRSAPRAI